MAGQVLGISLLATMLLILPGQASDSWVCTELIGNKSFVVRYKIDGDMLIHNNGRGHSTILENNTDHVISYIAIMSDFTRHLNNSPPVRVAEPSVTYLIIEKSSGRFTELSNDLMEAFGNAYGTLPSPDVKTGHCEPN
jgi:hypothetical protein